MDGAPQEGLSKKERYDLERAEKERAARGRTRARSLRRAALWTGACAAAGGGIMAFVIFGGGAGTGGETGLLANVVSATDWTKGNAAATITLIEYSDFQCPACKAYHPIVKQVLDEYGEKARFAYRHFPLPQHRNAKPAAYAAEAAGRQEKFWEMHDVIFDRQTEWAEARDAEARFRDYAASLGLDLARYDADIALDEIESKVEADYASGVTSRVNATPTFFLNGVRIQPRNYDEFKQFIEAALGNNS